MKKKGAALLTVVIITSVIFIVAVTVLDRSIRTYRDTMDVISHRQAYYAAESLIYDAVGYANSTATALNSTVQLDRTSGFRRIQSTNISSYTLLLTKVSDTAGVATRIYTYNIEADTRYGNWAYVVKMKIETTFVSNVYTGHRVLDRKTYKYKP